MMDKIAVIIPCLNEAVTVTDVVCAFRDALPESSVYVIDNGSSDGTGALASMAGAKVIHEPCRGKGRAVRKAFDVIDAECYLLCDGDGTYDPSDAEELTRPVLDGHYDMVVANRMGGGYDRSDAPLFHKSGNWLVRAVIRVLFNTMVPDTMSGYRAVSRKFVKRCPVKSQGFEVETEMTVRGICEGMRTAYVPSVYRERPDGSFSKVHAVRDGMGIMLYLFMLFLSYHPAVTVAGCLGICAAGICAWRKWLK